MLAAIGKIESDHPPHLGDSWGSGIRAQVYNLASGRLDLRVQSLLAVLADRHTIRLSCLRTGHSRFVKGTTRVSNHIVWRVVDIDMVDGRPVSRAPAAPSPYGWTAWSLCAPSEIGSPFLRPPAPTSPTRSHQEHIHIGYSYLPG